ESPRTPLLPLPDALPISLPRSPAARRTRRSRRRARVTALSECSPLQGATELSIAQGHVSHAIYLLPLCNGPRPAVGAHRARDRRDRKSTRLDSSHVNSS